MPNDEERIRAIIERSEKSVRAIIERSRAELKPWVTDRLIQIHFTMRKDMIREKDPSASIQRALGAAIMDGYERGIDDCRRAFEELAQP